MRQIQDSAPFEMFLSADEALVDELAKTGLTRDRGTLYAVGRIVLFAPTGSPLNPREGLDGLARLLASGRVTRFAIANPEHAPYGRAAEAALRKRELWNVLQPHLVLGETFHRPRCSRQRGTQWAASSRIPSLWPPTSKTEARMR